MTEFSDNNIYLFGNIPATKCFPELLVRTSAIENGRMDESNCTNNNASYI